MPGPSRYQPDAIVWSRRRCRVGVVIGVLVALVLLLPFRPRVVVQDVQLNQESFPGKHSREVAKLGHAFGWADPPVPNMVTVSERPYEPGSYGQVAGLLSVETDWPLLLTEVAVVLAVGCFLIVLLALPDLVGASGGQPSDTSS